MIIGKIHIFLFLITLVTTFLAGFLQGGSIIGGVSFSVALLFILGSHEMGHYLYGRKHGVDISPPYFIPAPPLISPIGTFGAFIKIRSPISTRRALFDIGVAGPLAGVVASIPVIVIGLKLSKVIETPSKDGFQGIALGSPLIFSALSGVCFGKIPQGQDIILHPVAFAGWIGLFVTALNLIPAGQLDGGHIIYALFSRKWYSRTSVFMIFVLLFLGVGTRPIVNLLGFVLNKPPFSSYRELLVFDGWFGWIMWAVILSLISTKHPPTLNDEIPLDWRRKLIGMVALAVFIGCFTPVPIKI